MWGRQEIERQETRTRVENRMVAGASGAPAPCAAGEEDVAGIQSVAGGVGDSVGCSPLVVPGGSGFDRQSGREDGVAGKGYMGWHLDCLLPHLSLTLPFSYSINPAHTTCRPKVYRFQHVHPLTVTYGSQASHPHKTVGIAVPSYIPIL